MSGAALGRRRRDERGSLAIEMAMIAPGLLLIFGLIFAYGRAGQVNGALESGTRDAARSATMARSYAEAEQRARQVVSEAIGGTPAACRHSLSVEVSDDYLPGEPITVTARCRYGLADLGLPGAPGTLTATSSFTSMLDPYRGVD
ncbi:MAG: pilus assembly protein [Nocardioides sp.]|uniref:TadE/TadG family type IV pilus assembly protein n=1 Tax=Nocardioides sp. TaxID=35761 RepID=UPI0039E69A4E